jgi:hypothetical protein
MTLYACQTTEQKQATYSNLKSKNRGVSPSLSLPSNLEDNIGNNANDNNKHNNNINHNNDNGSPANNVRGVN